MLATATALRRLAEELTDALPTIASIATDGDLLASAALAPRTAADVAEMVASVTLGPRGLGPLTARLHAEAFLLPAVVDAYQARDEASRWVDDRREEVALVGFFASQPGLLAGRAVGTAWRDIWADGKVDLSYQEMGSVLLDGLLENLYDNPWATDAAVRLVHGAQLPLAFMSPHATLFVRWAASANEGVTWPSTRFEDTVATVVAVAEVFGGFREGTGHAEADGFPTRPADDHVPDDLEGLYNGLDDVNGRANWGPNDEENPDAEFSTVRVMSVTQPDGTQAWVVQIPGTQVWDVTSGGNPVDATNNLRLVAGQDTAQNEAIVEAMRLAGIKPGEPVMLMGHSQGGITAMSLASDPDVQQEFTVTHVMTAGSPVSRFTPPAGVTVLSLEHEQDPVPRVDGRGNPASSDWVTVTRDSTGDLARPVKEGEDNPVDTAFESHVPLSNYTATARYAQEAGDPSVDRVVDGMSVFLTDDPNAVTSQDYRMTRELPEEPSIPTQGFDWAADRARDVVEAQQPRPLWQ
jgi:pimeloyl-ACP methyl ester carboxylesterase